MSKSVQELEQDLAAAREAQAERDRAARAEAEKAKDKQRRLDELRAERQSVLDGIEHLKGKIAQRQARVAELDAELKA